MGETLRILRLAGLPPAEARAYHALLRIGLAKAEDVAKAASIPRTRMYPVLRRLVDAGWATVEPGRPKRYRAVDPEPKLARLREDIARDVESATAELTALHAMRRERFAGALWALAGNESVSRKTIEMVERARAEILLVASFELPIDAEALPRALRAARSRGVAARLVIPGLDSRTTRLLARAVPQVGVRKMPLRFLLVDGSETLLAFPSDKGTGPRALWNPSRELAALFTTSATALWEEALGRDAPRGKGRERHAERDPQVRDGTIAAPYSLAGAIAWPCSFRVPWTSHTLMLAAAPDEEMVTGREDPGASTSKARR